MAGRRDDNVLVAGIDIGSTAVRVGVGQMVTSMDGSEKLQLMAATEVPSEGVQKGVVVSIDDTVSSVSNALEHTERMIGAPIEHAWIGVSGTHIMAQGSKGVVAVAKPDGEISEEDVGRAVDAARTVAPPLNYEVLHVLPKAFTVDGQTGIKDPVGMTGVRLEVETQIIYGLVSHIKNVSKAVYRTGLDIDDVVLSILAAGDAVTTARQKELGACVVNIGGSATSLVVYEEGDIIHTAVIPIGSAHITNDIAIGLRTSIDTAERVKIAYGHCVAKDISKREKINLQELGEESDEQVAIRYIAEIIEARVSEVLEKINNELGRVGKKQLLPAGVVFTGGGAKIDGLVQCAKEQLQLPASIGRPADVEGVTDHLHDLAFSTAIGLLRWGSRVDGGTAAGRTQQRFRSTQKVVEKLQNVWKSLIP